MLEVTTAKGAKEEGSTTEEDIGSAGESALTEDSEEVVDLQTTLAMEEQHSQEALRHYGARFGKDATSDSAPHVSQKPSTTPAKQAGRPIEEVLAELELDLDPGVALQDSPAAIDEDVLNPTFGYAGSLDENPPFAKFDIREHICMRVGGFKHGQLVRNRKGAELVVIGVKVGADGEPRLWLQPQSLGRPGAGAYRAAGAAQMRLKAVEDQGFQQLVEMKAEDFDGGEDSDGEETISCFHCRLPVGFQCFSYGKMKAPVHAECYAELMATDLKKEDEARQVDDAALKEKMRQEYDIGWHPEEVPSNMMSAVKLGCQSAPRGMCSIVFDPESESIDIAPTLEPAESVNLEYLSLALKVRMLEGREPLFSLDAVTSEGQWEKHMMQEKCFEPAWLEGTSVGEVLFQADYHLKELSMGVYEQPVVGMKSCVDFTEEVAAEDWNAREWFIVRKAEVLMTEDNTLIPRVKMGIEAREQVVGPNGMEDKTITRPSHPLVKYAEQFTHFFDLIAERKSVIYHLRDLAKASALAKLIVESNVNLDASWLELAGHIKEVSSMEIPQTWNHQVYSQVQVRDGEITTSANKERCRGVYGGVEFGLDKALPRTGSMKLSTSKPARMRPSVSITAPPDLTLSTQALPMPDVRSPLIAPKPMGAAAAAEPTPGAPAAVGGVRPLIKPVVSIESMTTPTRDFPVAARKGAVALAVPVPAARVAPESRPIPAGISAQRTMAVPEKVAVPSLPAAPAKRLGLISMTPIQSAIKGEVPRGVDLNLDQFSLSEPTRVQGHSWADATNLKCANVGSKFWSSIEAGSEFEEDDKTLLQSIYNPKLSDRRAEGELFVPPETSYEYITNLRALVDDEKRTQEQRTQHFCSRDFSVDAPGPLFSSSWTPSVEITREKMPGSSHLFARADYLAHADKFHDALKSATPTFDKSSEDGVRFRIYTIGKLEVRTTQVPEGQEVVGAVFSTNVPVLEGAAVEDQEKLVSVTEYIEKSRKVRRSYIVFETEQGNVVVTEKLEDGTVTWQENPNNLEARNLQAKLVRSADCKTSGVTSGCMKQFKSTQSELYTSIASSSDIKCYAQGAFSRALSSHASTGFKKSEKDAVQWQL